MALNALENDVMVSFFEGTTVLVHAQKPSLSTFKRFLSTASLFPINGYSH